jgi:formylglycine-generating enzyme required for sulfatase activity
MSDTQAGRGLIGKIRRGMNFRRLCLSALSAMLMLISPALPQQAGRVALVIGNNNYPDASTPLPSTIRDARALAEELRRSEFDVDLKENVGKADMQRAIDAFTGKIRNGTATLFYFSGYGIQVARQTYLLPVNAQVWTEADVRRDGISVDALLADMHRKGAKVKIIILDAAQRNPFERRFRPSAEGLAPLDAPEGTLALYSVAPGKVIADSTGANSPFVSELIKELRSPNLTAEEVFNRTRIGVSRASNNEQVPWVASSLTEEFYFGTPRTVATAPAPAPAPALAPTPAPAPTSPPSVSLAPSAAPAPAPVSPPVVPPVPEVAVATAPATELSPPNPKPGDTFRDCVDCPELVVLPAGSFDMGSASEYENPIHRVTFAKPFAIGRHEVTFGEWDKCVDEGGCKYRPDDRGWGRGERPAVNLSWLDAKAFVSWLSQKTGKAYRLPSEAEWEYAARAGTNTSYWWGRDVGSRQANCRECNTGEPQRTTPVGSFKPNGFGLFDTAGNVAEWMEDCWNDNYRGAPRDGTAWMSGQCRLHVLRGGAFDSQAKFLRSTSRFRYDVDVRYVANGFRVVRELP